MMKHFVRTGLIAILLAPVFVSCSGTEEVLSRHPYLSQLSNTDCLSGADIESRGNYTYGSFEMNMNGTSAECRFNSLLYSCDFGKVNIDVSFKDGVLTIVEYPSSNLADCICETDASFTINDMPDKEFMLKIYHGDTDGNYNVAASRFSGRVNLADGPFSTPY